jgi:4'-phosphopantetheinyl transferase
MNINYSVTETQIGKIYIFDDISGLDNLKYEDMLLELSKERAERAKRYIDVTDKKLCAASYILLKTALQNEKAINLNKAKITYNKYGKPYFDSPYNNVFFNIAHCKSGAACIVYDKEVGIDMQNVSKISDSVLNRICSESEKAGIENAADKDKQATKIWTVKEAVSKCEGTGITMNFKNIDYSVYKIITVNNGKSNYFITVCTRI